MLGPSTMGCTTDLQETTQCPDRASGTETLTGRAPVWHGTRPGDVAGALKVAGTTAVAMVRAVGAGTGDTVVVAGAAGGVGSIAVRLARLAGATVIGLASERHHDWLREHSIVPVTYGDGVADRIRAAAPGGTVDAFVDTVGGDYVQLALDLGVPASRVDTIVSFDAAEKFGVKAEGGAAVPGAGTLAELAQLIVAGEPKVPIFATYRLDQVQEAYRRLAEGHLLGKIVLLP